MVKTQEKAATSLTEISWLGKKVPVRSERLRVSLVKLQLVEGELGRSGEVDRKIEVYETLLMECQDTMQLAREEISSETVLQLAPPVYSVSLYILAGHLSIIA